MTMPSILRRSIPAILIHLAIALMVSAGSTTPARAMCSPFPCFDCDINNSGQATFIVMDRANGLVGVIPNIRLTGSANSFALVVPTPTVPTLHPVAKEIWQQATGLTAPPPRTFSSGGSGCGGDEVFGTSPEGRTDAIEIIASRTVGSFLATTIRATDPEGLVAWLRSNGFQVTEPEAQALGRYVTRGWVFTAMKLDPASPEARRPAGGWDVNVNPVEFRYAATQVEVPLELMAINRDGFFPVVFYLVDDHRVELAGFQPNYVNQISNREFSAIEERFPEIAVRLRPGAFLTRLDRTFEGGDAMSGSLMFVRAPSDRELNWSNISNGLLLPLESILFLAIPAGLFRRRFRR